MLKKGLHNLGNTVILRLKIEENGFTEIISVFGDNELISPLAHFLSDLLNGAY